MPPFKITIGKIRGIVETNIFTYIIVFFIQCIPVNTFKSLHNKLWIFLKHTFWYWSLTLQNKINWTVWRCSSCSITTKIFKFRSNSSSNNYHILNFQSVFLLGKELFNTLTKSFLEIKITFKSQTLNIAGAQNQLIKIT